MTSEQIYFLTLAFLNIVLALAGTRIKDLKGKPNSIYFLTIAFLAFSLSWLLYVFEPNMFMKIISAILSLIFIWGIIVFSFKRCEKNVPWFFISSAFFLHALAQSYFTYKGNFNAVLHLSGILIPLAFFIVSYLFIKIKKEINSSDIILAYVFIFMGIVLISRSIALETSSEIFSVTVVSSQVIWPAFSVAIGVFSFLSFTEEAQGKIKIESVTDHLTGILNRRGFIDALKNKKDDALALKQKLTFVLFDLDHFKNVNDIYGHDVGDKVLQKCAHQIKMQLRENDIFGRYGGEEFAILLFDVDLIKAQHIVERMRVSLEEMCYIYDTKNICITASFGLVEIKDSSEFNDIFIKADKALYSAKNNGRNKIEIGL